MTYEEIIKETASAIEQEALRAKGLKGFIYRGRCMFPLLREGDDMLVSLIPYALARPSDIIVYEEEGRLVVRRLLYTVAKKGKGLFMVPKADNSFRLSRAFPARFFVGKVIESRRNGRRIINAQAISCRLSMRWFWLSSLCEGYSFALASLLKRNIFSGLRLNGPFKRAAVSILRLPRYLLLCKLLREK